MDLAGLRSNSRLTERKQFRLIARLRNNRLMELREELGLNMRQLSAAASVSLQTCYKLEGCSASAYTRRGDWSPSAHKLAVFHGVSCDEIFPPQDKEPQRSKAEVKIALTELDAMAHRMLSEKSDEGLVVAVNLALSRLTERESSVLRARMDGESAADIARGLKLSRARVGQVEAVALRKLRHPNSNARRLLRDYLGR